MRRNALWCLLSLLLMLTGCKPTVPGKYISPGKMEDILYDYYLMKGVRDTDYEVEGRQNMVAYKAAVLRKYGVTQAEFDSSLVYYMRHADRMHDIYENLSDRFSDEAVALGASESEVSRYGMLSETGDTANIWKGSHAMIFMPMPPYNLESFKIEVDTLFQKGDRLMLHFDSRFIYQDGTRDGVVVLAMRFKNDSVASQLIHISNSQHYTLTVEDHDRLGIKEVKGYFMLSKGRDQSESATTFKLMAISNISLIRMHVPEPPKVEAPLPVTDTLSADTGARQKADLSKENLPERDLQPIKPLEPKGNLPRRVPVRDKELKAKELPLKQRKIE